jgi:predicted HAD superfamily Cof-like phosphohydrolase
MSKTEDDIPNSQKVRKFHTIFGHEIRATPGFPDEKVRMFRRNFIREELEELEVADDQNDIVGVADALGDLLYVVYGAALVYGIDIDAVFREIHRSNMSKLGEDGKPIYRESDNKVMKGPNYFKPDLETVLFGKKE